MEAQKGSSIGRLISRRSRRRKLRKLSQVRSRSGAGSADQSSQWAGLETLEPRLLLTADINGAGSYATIQAAIDAAVAGDTINVHAGADYVEDLVVNKGLTFQGDGGGTRIHGLATVSASDVTFNKFFFYANARAIDIDHSAAAGNLDNFDITNSFFFLDATEVAIQLGGNAASANQISDVYIFQNTFLGPAGGDSNPLRIGPARGGDETLEVTVTDLVFQDNDVLRGTVPILMRNNDLTNLTFQGNSFVDTEGAMYLWTQDAAPTGVLTNFNFWGNSIDNANSTNGFGIGFDAYGDKYTAVNLASAEIDISGNNAFTNIGILDLTAWGAAGYFGTISVNSSTLTLDTANFLANNTFGAAVANASNIFDQIQPVLDTAAAGETVTVYDGTYTGDLLIDKADLTLQSQNGKANTTIQLVDGVGIGVIAGANNFTLDGFTILAGAGGGTTFMLELTNHTTGVTIQNNTFTVDNGAGHGISGGIAGTTGLTIDNNTFTLAEDNTFGVYAPYMTDLTVTGNTFTAASVTGTNAVQFPGVTGTSEISGNTMTGFGRAIGIFHGHGVSGLLIDDNTITNGNKGIDFGEYNPDAAGDDNITTVTVTNNTLTGNTTALTIGNGAHVLASNFTITNNDFAGSATAGLENAHVTETVDAVGNWWGSISGPTVASNIYNVGNQGDAITGAGAANVTYAPFWLNDSINSGGVAWGPVTNLDTGAQYVSIQAALDAAADGETIEAADGSFTEDLATNVANLTLQSANGKANTTIRLVDGLGIQLAAGADNFTLDGFTVVDDAAGGATTFMLELTNHTTGVTIQNNTFTVDNGTQHGISGGIAGTAGLVINNNAFSLAEDNTFAVYAPYMTDLTVTDNTFTSASLIGTNAVQFPGVTGTSEISGNTMTGFGRAVGIFHASGVSGLLIDNNIITNGNKGIDFGEYNPGGAADGDITTVTITNNTITDNTTALTIGNGAHVLASNFTITNNNFGNSATAGIANDHVTEAVNAVANYWGESGGPDVATNTFTAPGSPRGSAITGAGLANVTYSRWLDDVPGVGVLFAPVQNIDTGAWYSSIQSALDAAAAGETIETADGTFTEDLVTGTANLTLQSQNGKANTTIQLVDGLGIQLTAGADGFTLDGFTITDDAAGAATTFMLELTNPTTGVTIQNNTFALDNGTSHGISGGIAGTAGLTIDNNAFTLAEDNTFGVYAPYMTDLTVTGNTFTAAGLTGTNAVQFPGVTGTSEISGNTMTGFGRAIGIFHGHGVSGLLIDNNTIASGNIGIDFGEYNPDAAGDDNMTTVTVTNNTLTGNTTALNIGNGAHVLASNFTIIYNRISGSTTAGLTNAHATETVTAAKNWWGDAEGPSNAANPHGVGAAGDAVTGLVTFLPWYATDTTTVISENVHATNGGIYAYSDTIQGGIDSAVAADTVEVGDGTYNEDLTVNKALTLQSTNGAATTNIQLQNNGTGIDLQAGAGNFTLGGAAGHGFTVLSGAGTGRLIELVNTPNGVEISHNTLDSTGNASMGLSVGAAGATGLTIDNNIFTTDTGDGAIWGPSVVDVHVMNNVIGGTGSYGVQFSGVTTTGGGSDISYNAITGMSGSGGVVISNGAGTSGLTIMYNDINGGSNGVYLVEYSPGAAGDMTTVDISNNDLSGNDKAIKISDGAHVLASNFVILDNNLDSTTAGLENAHATEVVNAAGNWWGSADATVVAAAAGANVDYSPYLYTATNNAVGFGFEGDFSNLGVDDDSPQTAGVGAIQEGINMVTGSTVNVAPGTYVENLTFLKPTNLMGEYANLIPGMRTAGAAGESVICGVHTITDTGAGGVEINGFTLNDPNPGVADVLVTLDSTANALDDVGLTHNFFELDPGDIGVQLDGVNLISNVAVNNNQFDGPVDRASTPLRIGHGDYTVNGPNVTGVDFLDNTVFRGTVAVNMGDNSITDMHVNNNTFKDTAGAMHVSTDMAAPVVGVLSGFQFNSNFVDNTDNDQGTGYALGFDIYQNHYADANFGAGNIVTGNSLKNIDTVDLATQGYPGGFFGGLWINSNLMAAYEMNAESNYWGSPTGPTHAGNPGGTGASVSDYVDYTPFETAGLAVDLVPTWIQLPTTTVNTIVPGDGYLVGMRVTNVGDALAWGTIDVDMYFNDTQAVPGGGEFYALDNTGVYLPAGSFVDYYAWFTVPTENPCDWYFVGDIGNPQGFTEITMSNNSVASVAQPLAWQFGTIDAGTPQERHNVPLNLTDPTTNVQTYFYMYGAGNGEVTAYDAATGWDVNLTGTDATSMLYLVSVGGNTNVNNFTTDGPVGYFYGTTTNVNGAVNIDAGASGITYFYANSMTGGGEFNATTLNYLYTVGGFNADLNLDAGANDAYAVNSATVYGNWAGTVDVAQGGLQSIYTGGNFNANLTLADADGGPYWWYSVSSATVIGNQTGNWNIDGNMNSYYVYGNSAGDVQVNGLNDASYSVNAVGIYGDAAGTWFIGQGGLSYWYVGGDSNVGLTLWDATNDDVDPGNFIYGVPWGISSATTVGNQTGSWDINGTMSGYYVYGNSTGDMVVEGLNDASYSVNSVGIYGDAAGIWAVNQGGLSAWYVAGDSTVDLGIWDATNDDVDPPNGIYGVPWGISSATTVGNQTGNWTVNGTMNGYYVYGDSTGDVQVSGLNDASYSVNSVGIYGDAAGTWDVNQGGLSYWYVGGDSTVDLAILDATNDDVDPGNFIYGVPWGVSSATTVGNQTGNWDINGTMSVYSVYGNSTGNVMVQGLDDASYSVNSATIYGNATGDWFIGQGGLSYWYVAGNSAANLTLDDADGGAAWWNSLGTAYVIGDMSGLWAITGQVGMVYTPGWMNGLDLRSTGNMQTIYAGGMKDTTVFAGVGAGYYIPANQTTSLDGVDVYHLPTAGDMAGNNTTIQTVYILGTAGMAGDPKILNSSIAADNVGFAWLQHAQTVNAQGFGETFGVLAPNITTLYYFDGAYSYVLNNNFANYGANPKDDFLIRQV